ncbi:hypothetical protein EZV62_022484 [Acer yangbiense]|uniref:Uncharacterized protein n=1 Tax=Acer yangbiense TaxID=1000413 RepID=A0A5C7HA04_9ROSI|nr:hypothetical protein EZV62_022484 [Acer yangbiense]
MMINKIQAQSSVEVEYIAAVANQAIWIRKVLTKLNYVQEEPTGLWSEEQLVDILTKALAGNKFNVLRTKLGVFKKSLKEEC